MVAFGAMMMVGPRRWVSSAQAAEEAGFESVWVPEHLVMPVTMTGAPGTPHEGEPPISASTPAFDPWVQMATMAAVTQTVKFGVNVYNIGLRHPIITARSLTTLDNASNGRVVLGIGASWLRQEWDAMQLDFDSRGRRIDETLEVIQRLFTEDEIAHNGHFFTFSSVGFLPKSVQKPWPPLLIGGDSKPAMRRAARLGDGWIPMSQTPETLPANLQRLQEMRAAAGRNGPFEVTVQGAGGTLDSYKRWRDAGATRILVTVNARDPDAYRRFAEDVIAKV
jgi:probable F420-dependent oxidoreductase